MYLSGRVHAIYIYSTLSVVCLCAVFMLYCAYLSRQRVIHADPELLVYIYDYIYKLLLASYWRFVEITETLHRNPTRPHPSLSLRIAWNKPTQSITAQHNQNIYVEKSLSKSTRRGHHPHEYIYRIARIFPKCARCYVVVCVFGDSDAAPASRTRRHAGRRRSSAAAKCCRRPVASSRCSHRRDGVGTGAKPAAAWAWPGSSAVSRFNYNCLYNFLGVVKQKVSC